MVDGRVMSGSEIRSRREESQPTKKASGIARVNSGDVNVLGNNCAGSDDHLIADRHREDRGICSDTYSTAKLCRSPELWLAGGSAGAEQVVNKHRAMRNEAVVADRNEVTDERVGLNATTLADDYSLLYLNERSNESFIADVATI
jgi:hypothetical protein